MIIVDSEIISGGRWIDSTVSDLIEISESYETILDDLAKNGFADVLISQEIEKKAEELKKAIGKLNTSTENIMQTIYDYIEEVEAQDKYIGILD